MTPQYKRFIMMLTIDRIDNDGNYEPNNCEWVTIQENLKRRNRSNGWKSK